jgi:hypothetical protein
MIPGLGEFFTGTRKKRRRQVIPDGGWPAK